MYVVLVCTDRVCNRVNKSIYLDNVRLLNLFAYIIISRFRLLIKLLKRSLVILWRERERDLCVSEILIDQVQGVP